MLSSQGTTCAHGGQRALGTRALAAAEEHRKQCREDRHHDASPADL